MIKRAAKLVKKLELNVLILPRKRKRTLFPSNETTSKTTPLTIGRFGYP